MDDLFAICLILFAIVFFVVVWSIAAKSYRYSRAAGKGRLASLVDAIDSLP